MRKRILLFAAMLLCLGAWAQETTPVTDSEWQLLQELRTNLIGQGNEVYLDSYWSLANDKAGASYWTGVGVSDEGHVTYIDLSNDNLHLDSIPQVVFRFPHLIYLEVMGKELTGNIEDIVRLTDIPCAASLTSLYLGQNHFTGNVGALAQLFPNLESLDVESNKITEVDPMVSQKVTGLWMYNQQLDSIYTINFRAPLSKEGLMASLPSIMLYNHEEQAFVKDLSFSITPDIENFDLWYMMLNAGVNPEYFGSEFSVATWNEDPAFRYGYGDTLYVNGSIGTCRAKILFRMCDADFNGAVDIADLQMMLNYILGTMSYSTVLNLTATDLYHDSLMNVQDIVRMVDTLLTHSVPVVFEAPRRAPESETAEATLYWLDGELHLRSSKAVASMQIEIATEGTVMWQLTDEWLKGERAKGTKAVIYSLNGATMPAETDIVLAHCSEQASVRAAALSDATAKHISVQLNSPAIVTGVETISNFQSPITNKVIKDGRLIIIRGNKMYNAQGIEL